MRIRHHAGILAAGLVAWLLLAGSPARAIIVFEGSIGGDGRNLDSIDPTPFDLDRYVGTLGPTLGTPISSRYFVTASHVALGTTVSFTYSNGTGTPTTYEATVFATNNDLKVFRLDDGQPDFSLWAPVYSQADEVGRALVALGRGARRGAELRMPNNPSGDLRGWAEGTADGQLSWGTNAVSSIQDFGSTGSMLYFTFDQGAGPDEAMFSNHDSGGVVFIQDPADDAWKLAGINTSVDGLFSYTSSGPYSRANLFDARGFYVGNAGNNELIDPGLPAPVPAGSYATRLSTRFNWLQDIGAVTVVPEPASISLLGLGWAGLVGFRRLRRICGTR